MEWEIFWCNHRDLYILHSEWKAIYRWAVAEAVLSRFEIALAIGVKISVLQDYAIVTG